MSALMLMKRNLFATPKRMYSAAASGGHGGGMKLWKNLSLFGAIPACILMAVKVYLDHQKEHECGHQRPEFIPYEHLRIRTKRFPWGDGNHSLFHNPHANALPEGYEDEEH